MKTENEYLKTAETRSMSEFSDGLGGGMRIVFASYRQIAKRIRNKSDMLDILRIREYN